MKIILIRHGETERTLRNNWYGYGLQFFSAPIVDEGKPTIRKQGEYLKNIKTDINFSSKFKRCIETSEIISNITGKNFIYDSRLNDISEPFAFFKRRIVNFMKEVEKESCKSILICTHGAVIAAIEHYYLFGDITSQDLVGIPQIGIMTILDDKKVEKINFKEK